MKTNIIQIQDIVVDELTNIIADKLLLKIEKYILDHATKQNDELLTRIEMSNILKISLGTVDNWSKCDVLMPYRIGNKIRFKKSEIQDALIKINS